jgi:hypothetical protein
MDALARALILATIYLDGRACHDALDDDIAALENISAELQNCSMDERLCLIRVAGELGFESWAEEMGIL